MESLLFLAHRIPYPPNKGDKIRSFNFLKKLSAHYRVYLAAFIDDADDWQYVERVGEYCSDVCLLELKSSLAKIRSLLGFANGRALTIPYYGDARMSRWVADTMKQDPFDHVFVFSAAMAQYAPDRDVVSGSRVIDFVDVDSEKWRQYAGSHSWPMNCVYRREAKKLFDYERATAVQFDRAVFVSEQEARFFSELAPETSGRVTCIENGVDAAFFDPHAEYRNPYADNEEVLVFTGAMDYWANIDAVTWFAREVFPHILSRVPQARFYIVGSHPSEEVRGLAHLDGVVVTGAVGEIRSYMAHAVAAVAPLRIARGVQNKVLEAMSMGKPVVATSKAMDGIRAGSEFQQLVSDSAVGLAQVCVELLERGDENGLGARGRELVSREYSWEKNQEKLLGLVGGSHGRRTDDTP